MMVRTPDLRQDSLARKHLSLRRDEAPQDVELRRGEPHRDAVLQDLPSRGVDLQAPGEHTLATAALLRAVRTLDLAAAQHRLHSREQLGQPKGFGDVVLGAELEAQDFVVLGAPGAEHDDRDDAALAPELLHYGEAIQFGQHDVQDQQVELGALRRAEAALPVGLQLDHVALRLEVQLEAEGDAVVVFDDEDPARFGHGAFVGGSGEGVVARGRTRENVLPRPGLLSSSTRPRWAFITCFTMARPSPEPSCSRDKRSSTR